MESVVLSEIDLQLLHALQINPRAPWNIIGLVLGVSPATAARRWERLRELAGHTQTLSVEIVSGDGDSW